MKKIFTLALLAVFALVSCTPNSKDPVAPYPEACDKHDVDLILSETSGIYYGNQYCTSEDVYNYGLVISNKANVYDLVSGDIVAIWPNSQYFFLDLYSATPSQNYSISFKVPNGVYNFDLDNSTNAGTVGAEYSYLVLVGENTESEEDTEIVSFESGVVTVSDNLIDAVLITADGKQYHIQCSDDDVDNTNAFGAAALPGEYSTLTDNVSIPFAEPMVFAEHYGDYYVIGKDSWVLYLYDFAAGHTVMLELLAPVSNGTELPLGTFAVSNDITKSQVALPGYVDAYGEMYFSWYALLNFETEETLAVAPVKTGTVTISKEGEDYSVAFDLKDDLGNAITGTCVAYVDIYSEAAGASLLSASVNNQPKAPKFANHAKKQLAPRKVKISSLIKK
ncbi:MAG: hypothetical protein IKB90_00840 [Alistipes sp.]|nr:hypothetical protein [Alistipes sp.]